MSFVNILARAELKEDLFVNDILTVDNLINTKNITISGNITLLSDATFDGNFINDFVETDTFTDAEGNLITNTETINLYEKIERIESKINANTLAHSTNAGAIASRYTKTQADLKFVDAADAKITGDIKIREVETDDFETLTTKLSRKVDTTTLQTTYTTTTDLNLELDKKVAIEEFEETYLSHLAPLNSPTFTGIVIINDVDIVDTVNGGISRIDSLEGSTDIISNEVNTINQTVVFKPTDWDINDDLSTYVGSRVVSDEKLTEIDNNISTNANNITTNANNITTNANNIQTNANAIQTKEDIEALKIMINMLAYGVQPNLIRVSQLSSRVQFGKVKQPTFPIWGNTLWQFPYTTTQDFLTDLYHYLESPVRSALAPTFTEQNQFRLSLSESGTNGNGTGGFLFRIKILLDNPPKTFPADFAQNKLFFEDDYVVNKTGYLSIPQILRTGQLTYTRVSDSEYTITAEYPHFTI